MVYVQHVEQNITIQRSYTVCIHGPGQPCIRSHMHQSAWHCYLRRLAKMPESACSLSALEVLDTDFFCKY